MKKLAVLFLVSVMGTQVFAQVANSPEEISPLLVSEKVPSVKVTSAKDKQEVLFTDITTKKRSIVLFYRGGWCPYCNAHLSDIAEAEDEIVKEGYQIIAISPDAPEFLGNTIEKEELNYQLFSDADGQLMQAMGIAFKTPERYSNRLAKFSEGKNTGFLPVPSLFVVDTDGTILFEYISPKYSERISSKLLLSVLKNL
jgi:peroxiredoxin